MFTTSIRDFKKEKIIGKGSFGSVYLVRRRQDNKVYALKSVKMEKLNKKEQENSVNEVRILASVNHPNVIGYKEAFWDDDGISLNIVMEYADDGDLHTKIEKMRKEGGYFSEPLIWSYSIQMIEGLKALHDKKIMHRDLKSANIFLIKDKHQCKIGDMNVSKVIKEKLLKTQTGTPYYASPEVWNDDPYSYKSDLWSIGCVIYEMCALRPPFNGKDFDELYENVCRGHPQRINKIYSDDLWKMILMLLQVDVKKRVDCNKFLNSELIKRKIEELKNDQNLEALRFIDYHNNNDNFLLETIKFNTIKEIKAQLPTKKNYNTNLQDSFQKVKPNQVLYSKKNDEILCKKIKEKQIEYEKMKNFLKKNQNNKIKIINLNNSNKKEKTENSIKTGIRVYKKNNLIKNILKSTKREYSIKTNQTEVDIHNNNRLKNNKLLRKKINICELYLKKFVPKVHKRTNSYQDNNTFKIKNDRLLSSNLVHSLMVKNTKYSHKKYNSNCFTNVDRIKHNQLTEEDKDFAMKHNTIEVNDNYVYTRPNIITSQNPKPYTHDRAQSATRIYKVNQINHPSSLKKKIPISTSLKKNIEHVRNQSIKYDSPKLNKYNSYGISLLLNSKLKTEENEKNRPIIPYHLNKGKNISIDTSKYIKKLNVKSYHQKLMSLQNDNILDKKDIYGRILHRTKNSSKLKVKNSHMRKKIKIDLDSKKSNCLLTNSSNTFLRQVKNLNNSEGNNSLVNCFLSPKTNNSQVFNNFYSINLPIPVRVINVYKK